MSASVLVYFQKPSLSLSTQTDPEWKSMFGWKTALGDIPIDGEACGNLSVSVMFSSKTCFAKGLRSMGVKKYDFSCT